MVINTEEIKNDFEEYVEKYSRSYHVTPEEAKQHKVVQEVKKHYEGREA